MEYGLFFDIFGSVNYNLANQFSVRSESPVFDFLDTGTEGASNIPKLEYVAKLSGSRTCDAESA